ncbi:unnamed protein product, partial [Ectocarpus sp. 4 AP-2014]
ERERERERKRGLSESSKLGKRRAAYAFFLSASISATKQVFRGAAAFRCCKTGTGRGGLSLQPPPLTVLG